MALKEMGGWTDSMNAGAFRKGETWAWTPGMSWSPGGTTEKTFPLGKCAPSLLLDSRPGPLVGRWGLQAFSLPPGCPLCVSIPDLIAGPSPR